jgi:sugar lactone lactonase YvrE
MRVTQADFAKQVRDALAHVYDPVALRAHPLSLMLVATNGRLSKPQGGAALRLQLIAAIGGLKPGPQTAPNAKAWRPYRILQLRYVEGYDPSEVQHQLGLSKSQYYREHEAALGSLVALLGEQGWASRVSAASDMERPDAAALAGDEPTGVVRSGDAEVTPARTPQSRQAWRWGVIGGCGLGVLVVALSLLFLSGIAFPSRASVEDRTGSRASASGQPSPERDSGAPPASATLSVYAGTGEAGHTNGPAAMARFAGPLGLTIDDGGTIYVADTGNHRIRSITSTGLVLDVAGSGREGYADGPSALAQFSSPNAVTVGPDGTIYVADAGNLRIRAISPSGVVSTVAGSGLAGFANGLGTAAQFAVTGAIVADRAGNLYVPDRLNSVLRKISPAGVVSTFAGSGMRGHADGPADVAQFNVPVRMGVDAIGNVYVVDIGDNRIRRITPEGVVSTVVGSGQPGFADGPVAQARFSETVMGICLDAFGNLYVMDAGNHRIRKVSPDGAVSTLFEFTNPDQTPANMKVDRAGKLYLSDRPHNVIYKVTVPRGS